MFRNDENHAIKALMVDHDSFVSTTPCRKV